MTVLRLGCWKTRTLVVVVAAVGTLLALSASSLALAGSQRAFATSAPAPRSIEALQKKRASAFPVDQFYKAVLRGELFVGGNPPKIVGVKGSEKEFPKKGSAPVKYQIRVAWRRAGRDGGNDKFTILRARSWTAALGHVLALNPGLVNFVHDAFPKALFTRPFPPLLSKLNYSLEIAKGDCAQAGLTFRKNRKAKGKVFRQKHPQNRKRLVLEQLDKGLAPGRYCAKLTAEAGLANHPMKSFYELYETANGVKEWVTIAAAPFEVALDAVTEKAVGALLEKVYEQGPPGAAELGAFAGSELGDKLTKKAIKTAVSSAFTKTESTFNFDVVALVPKLIDESPSAAARELRRRGLQVVLKKFETRDRKKLGPGGRALVFAQTCPAPKKCAPGSTAKAGTSVTIKYRALKRGSSEPPAPPTDTASGTWTGTWSTDFGTMVLTQSGNSVSGCYTHDGGTISGSINGNVLSGTWTENERTHPTDPGLDTGTIEFVMSSSGGGYSGTWTYTSTGSGGSWSGSRVATPSTPPC